MAGGLLSPRSGIRLVLIAIASSAALAVVFAPSVAHATAVLFDDEYTVGAGEVYVASAAQGVFANDVGIDFPVGIRVSSASHGFVDVSPEDGSFTYEPEPGFVGVDAFTYCVTTLASWACIGTPANVRLRVESIVERIGGADRYGVSAAVSAAKFAPNADIAYVASGEVFPDALSASAAAGVTGSPVLLVSKGVIPAAVRAELARLKPQKIVVLGGGNTIADTVERALQDYAPIGAVERIGGTDRYAVSAAISAATFSGSAGGLVAYIASGEVFPDALSGSAAAGLASGPVLLVGNNVLPTPISDELTRLAPAKIVILGGESSVSTAVETQLRRWATTVRIAGIDRFAVSAALSAASFERSATHTVFVASGAVFSDALSGSAAAIAREGPVLLVTANGVPEVVAAELDRLRPVRIVVLGGPNTISEATAAALKRYLAP